MANLNVQEKLFVDDPENAHLFDVEVEQSGRKRKTDTEGPPSLAKTKKTDNPEKDEVNYLALNKQSSSQN